MQNAHMQGHFLASYFSHVFSPIFSLNVSHTLSHIFSLIFSPILLPTFSLPSHPLTLSPILPNQDHLHPRLHAMSIKRAKGHWRRLNPDELIEEPWGMGFPRTGLGSIAILFTENLMKKPVNHSTTRYGIFGKRKLLISQIQAQGSKYWYILGIKGNIQDQTYAI
jgi:hypothetical protein